MKRLDAACVIAGGGPAGLMLGYLLARQGVSVIVLEKHKDFLRDFRGDTVHPSTLELFHQLGLAEGLLNLPHDRTSTVSIHYPEGEFPLADFSRLKLTYPFIAMMPQWHFLNFLAGAAKAYPNFTLLRETEATGLIEVNDRVIGVTATGPDGDMEIHAGLSVAADGRNSSLREAASLKVKDIGAPIDVFWFRLPRTDGMQTDSMASVGPGGFLVQINRGDYWQCAMPIPKGGAETIRAEGLTSLKRRIASAEPDLTDEAEGLESWDDVKLLNVQVDRLETWWKPGFLCIGDSAHAMSPVGGVGVNLAIQDAVAAGRMLGPGLKLDGRVGDTLLDQVQDRREWPAKATQWAQVTTHKRIIAPLLEETDKDVSAPGLLEWVSSSGLLRGVLARAIGLGARPEHWPDSV